MIVSFFAASSSVLLDLIDLFRRTLHPPLSKSSDAGDYPGLQTRYERWYAVTNPNVKSAMPEPREGARTSKYVSPRR
ncbi:MAG: hypothetical protein D6679_04570 [Candidatus Hydrogenedentota bacterium]|nr:MAG: hypothetical protein D6679_04570 [Candidatus Hydrogenedentota bacterium]